MSTRVTPDQRLWRGHPATPAQQQVLPFDPDKRPTQRDVVLALLRTARTSGTPLDLPTILHTGIAQYCARIAELRAAGHVIENRLERIDGVTHSWYELVHDVERDAAPERRP